MQEYEGVLDQWMAEFHYLLTYTNPALAETDAEKESVVDAVKGRCVRQHLPLHPDQRGRV